MSSTKTRKVLFKVKTLVDAAQDTHVADSASSTTNWNNESNSLIYSKLNAAITALNGTKNTEIGIVDGANVTSTGNVGVDVGTYYTGLRDTDDGSGNGFVSNVYSQLSTSIKNTIDSVTEHNGNNFNSVNNDITDRLNTKALKSAAEALDEYAQIISSAIDFNDGAYVYETSRVQGLPFVSDHYAPDFSDYERGLNDGTSESFTETEAGFWDTIKFDKYKRVYVKDGFTGLLYTKVVDTTAVGGTRRVLIRQGGLFKTELHNLSGGCYFRNGYGGYGTLNDTVNLPEDNYFTPEDLKVDNNYVNPEFGFGSEKAVVYYSTYRNFYYVYNPSNDNYYIIPGFEHKPGKHYDEIINSSTNYINANKTKILSLLYDSLVIKPKYAAELVLENDKVYMSSTTNLFYVKQDKNIVGAGYVPLYTKYGYHFKSNIYGNTAPSMADLVSYDCFYFAGSDTELTGEEVASIGENPVLIV